MTEDICVSRFDLPTVYARIAHSRTRVPAADAKISQQAMDETFYLTNIAPQVGDGFNRHCE
jgi:hypothetical protein